MLNFTAQNGISGAYANGVLTLSGTASVADYQAALRAITYSSSAADPWAAGTDTSRAVSWQVSDGTLSSALATSALDIIPCYCEGTRIRTARGEVAVEALRAGDLAVTASGAARPVVWIGSRRLHAARHRAPENVWPVRIAAGAFAENRPRRDLWVSPGHNIAVEGVLVPAILLANGATVAQVETESISYYHVEIDAHDIVLAEGLPAESYLDCGNRDAFANGGGALELHPDFGPKDWRDTCLPIHKDGPAVEAAKAKLLARAEALGHSMTSDPEPRLLADGRVIGPARSDGRRYVFAIPRGARRLVLASRRWRPGHMSPASADDRLLGMLVTRLECDGVAQPLAAMGEGWRALESADWRWTGGMAVLPPALREIVVETDGAPLYWREDAATELFGFGGFHDVRL
nr:Hint domain-containing protein [Rhodoblastus sphagnicola]